MHKPALLALKTAMKTGPKKRFPGRSDGRFDGRMLIPDIAPGFALEPGMSVFTIGSCFARNIEAELDAFTLPTLTFSVPKDEWPHRPNGLLNEYNPAAMAQRIRWAAEDVDTSAMTGSLVGPNDAVDDLFLSVGNSVNRARAIERRREIDAVYRKLPGADALILTLGLVECWEDTETSHFLNRMPPVPVMRADPGRYRFHRLSPFDGVSHLQPALEALIDRGLSRVILTVSPVPLQTTVTGQDCVIANSLSKAALRVVAEELVARFRGKIDYFPSYEMIISAGLAAFRDDLVHVRPGVVAKVVQHMTRLYVQERRAA